MNFSIDNITVEVDKKEVLNDFSLVINKSEIHAIMGPNGAGKSSLSKAIMGYPDYKVTSGDIIANGSSLTAISIDERAKLGIFLVHQNPISIDGVSNRELLKASFDANNKNNQGLYQFIKETEENLKSLKMQDDMLSRSFNVGFSGGEKKKNEILQLLTLKPSFIILDELDSGLDVDSLKIVCDVVNNYLKENPTTSVLIITHYTRILDYIKPNYVHILKDKKIVKSGDYELAKLIEKNGYNQSFVVSGDGSCE